MEFLMITDNRYRSQCSLKEQERERREYAI